MFPETLASYQRASMVSSRREKKRRRGQSRGSYEAYADEDTFSTSKGRSKRRRKRGGYGSPHGKGRSGVKIVNENGDLEDTYDMARRYRKELITRRSYRDRSA